MSEELRIKIAESIRPGVRIVALEDREPVWILGDAGFCRGVEREPVPDYQNDANAALQLVEVLAKEGWEWEAYNYGEGVVFAFIMHEARFEATAPTLPEAICLAYCAVKSIQTNE